MAADPIWCRKCGCNLDLEDFNFSKGLQEEFIKWAADYGRWVDWTADKLVSDGIEIEEEHNRKGSELTDSVIKELGCRYSVTFSPSTIGKSYSMKGNW
ncbi:hypothetical protein BSG1_03640 [Bacillus sp. SG-1]|nr:hypothetical protein BSG1_03640 [Bacillus sp. SG-1]